MLRNLIQRIGTLWRQLEQLGTQERSILAVMSASSGQDDLRVFSIQEGWRVLFATTLESAIRIRQMNRMIRVILYDCDLLEGEWREGLVALLNCAEPVFVIVLSHLATPSLWLAALESGGYAVTGKPLDRPSLAALVKSALQLEDSIDSCRVLEQV